MISGKKIKRNTQLILVGVILLTIATMNVSYSAFFSVQSTNTQTITTGTFAVTASVTSALSPEELLPSEDYKSITAATSSVTGATNCADLTVNNTGTIKSSFTITMGADTGNEANLANIIVGVQNSAGQWQKPGNSGAFTSSLTALANSGGNYTIITGTVNNKTAVTYKVCVWLNSETPDTEIDKPIKLKLNATSKPDQGQQ